MKNNKVSMRKGMLLFLTLLVPLLVSNAHALTNITSCQTLSSADTYNLTQNIENAGLCFTIASHNVTLNCNDYNITFAGNGNSGIISNGYDNLTIMNCHVYQNETDNNQVYAYQFSNLNNLTIQDSSYNLVSDTAVSYGVYIYADNYVTIINLEGNNNGDNQNCVRSIFGDYITVTNSSFNVGNFSESDCLYFELGENHNVSYNNINTDAYFVSDGTSIRLNSITNSNVHNNIIYTTGTYSYGINSGGSSLNNTIYDNQITTYGQNGLGIANHRTNNTTVTNNNITINGINSVAIYLWELIDNNVSYNNIVTYSSGSHGVYLTKTNEYDTNNNYIGYNTINVTDSNTVCIYLRGFAIFSGMYDYNTIENNILIDNGNMDLSAWGQYWNNTNFKDQKLRDYWITNELFSFENSTYGLVNFTEPISSLARRDSLIGYADSDIIISDNYVMVNSSASGLNKPANITLYNIGDRGFIVPVILKDGVPCDDCVNYTNLDATNVMFSVTGFSEYEIGDNYTTIEMTIYSPTNTTYQSSTPTASVDVNISVNDTLNTAWYELDSNGTNTTFTPNTTVTVDEGLHNLTIWVNNTYGAEDTIIIYFTYEQVVSELTGWFGVDVEGISTEFVAVMLIFIPIIVGLSIIYVFRDGIKDTFEEMFGGLRGK